MLFWTEMIYTLWNNSADIDFLVTWVPPTLLQICKIVDLFCCLQIFIFESCNDEERVSARLEKCYTCILLIILVFCISCLGKFLCFLESDRRKHEFVYAQSFFTGMDVQITHHIHLIIRVKSVWHYVKTGFVYTKQRFRVVEFKSEHWYLL